MVEMGFGLLEIIMECVIGLKLHMPKYTAYPNTRHPEAQTNHVREQHARDITKLRTLHEEQNWCGQKRAAPVVPNPVRFARTAVVQNKAPWCGLHSTARGSSACEKRGYKHDITSKGRPRVRIVRGTASS